MERFGFSQRQLPYFRTIHSMAFLMLGLNRNQTLQYSDYKRLGALFGMRVTGDFEADGREGQLIKFVEEQARVRCMDLVDCGRELAPSISPFLLRKYRDSLDAYKLDILGLQVVS
jgi:hypothetical protein